MNERKKGQPLEATAYLAYLKEIIKKYDSIRNKYALFKMRVKNNSNLLKAESLAPIIAEIYLGLLKETIVPKKDSHEANLIIKVKNILDSLQAMIETSLIPKIQIDPKTKKITTNFPNILVSEPRFNEIKSLLKNFQFNAVIYDALSKILETKKVPENLIQTIQSFLDFDEKQPLSLSSKELNENNTKIQVKGAILEPFIERLPNRVLQSMLHSLRYQLHYHVSKPQKFLKQFEIFISEIKKNKKSINLSQGITTLDLNKRIDLWEEQKIRLGFIIERNIRRNIPIEELYTLSIQEIKKSLEDIAVKNTLEEKMHLQTQYNPEKFYPITLEAAQKIGMITQEQSTNIQKKIQEKQKLCQLLQDATPEPEPFSWVEDFPEPEL